MRTAAPGLTLIVALALPASAQTIPTWTIAPSMSIESDGTPATEFSRIVAALRLGDGRIAVANAASNDIRIFDAAGRYVRTFGRAGAGPGEFRRLGWVGRAGDTAFFHDSGLRRLMSVLLASEPKMIAAVPIQLESDRGSIYVPGRLSDGRWVVATSVSPSWDLPVGSRVKQSVGWAAPSADGKITWIGRLDGMTIWSYHPTGNVEKGSVVGAAAFTPWVYATASGESIWFGDSATDSLFMVGANGTSKAVRLPIPRRRPTQRMIEKARDAELALARTAMDSAATRDRYSPPRVPRELPVFESLKPGPGGEIWIQERAIAESDAVRYLVVGANGAPRAWLNTPAGVRLMDIGTDYAVGVHKDDDGVETVRVYRLTRR